MNSAHLDFEQDKMLWVIGEEGAYCILKPRFSSLNCPDNLGSIGDIENNGAHRADQDVFSEDLRVCKDLPTYPYFEGWAIVQEDGATAWGLEEGMQYIVAGQEIPLITAVFW